MNEKVYDIADKLSDRIELSMKFQLKQKFASENYQVMNYGLGGSIVGHVDSIGKHCWFEFSACGGIHTGIRIPVLTAYFPVLA